MTTAPASRADAGRRVDIALGLAVLAVVLYIVAMAVAGDDESSYGWLWPVSALVGGVAAVTGWRAGSPRPRGRALAAVVLGGLVFLAIAGWLVVAAFTGDL